MVFVLDTVAYLSNGSNQILTAELSYVQLFRPPVLLPMMPPERESDYVRQF